MNYKTLASNPRRNTHHFFVDMVQGLQHLPKEVASTALVAATGETYICTNDKQWVLFKPKGHHNHSGDDTTPSDDSQNQDTIVQNDMGMVFIYATEHDLPYDFQFEGCEFYLPNDLNTPIFAKVNFADSDWNGIRIPQGCVMKLYYNDNDPDRIGTFVFYTEEDGTNRRMHEWVTTNDDPVWKENNVWTYQCAIIELPKALELAISISSYNSETGN